MDLAKVKSAYENGLPPFPTEPEEWFAVVVANHMKHFRETFVTNLSEFRAIMWDRRSDRRVQLASGPHTSFVMHTEAARALKPHHANLVSLHHKNAFRRLQKGAHTVCLQASGRANGRVELWVERRDTTAPAPPEDEEDKANLDASNAYLLMMVARGLCGGK